MIQNLQKSVSLNDFEIRSLWLPWMYEIPNKNLKSGSSLCRLQEIQSYDPVSTVFHGNSVLKYQLRPSFGKRMLLPHLPLGSNIHYSEHFKTDWRIKAHFCTSAYLSFIFCSWFSYIKFWLAKTSVKIEAKVNLLFEFIWNSLFYSPSGH